MYKRNWGKRSVKFSSVTLWHMRRRRGVFAALLIIEGVGSFPLTTLLGVDQYQWFLSPAQRAVLLVAWFLATQENRAIAVADDGFGEKYKKRYNLSNYPFFLRKSMIEYKLSLMKSGLAYRLFPRITNSQKRRWHNDTIN